MKEKNAFIRYKEKFIIYRFYIKTGARSDDKVYFLQCGSALRANESATGKRLNASNIDYYKIFETTKMLFHENVKRLRRFSAVHAEYE